MADIEIELDAYVIPDEHGAWKLFPGKTYRFYKIVRDASAAFLDVRGLAELGDPSAWTDTAILRKIANDRWQRELAKVKPGGRPKGSEAVNRTDKRTLTFLKSLLFTVQKGDLIIVPSDGYQNDVLVGEVLSDPGNLTEYTADDDGTEYIYMGRPVRWLGRQEKRELSRELIKLLHTPTAFFSIPRGNREEIYQIAYKSFVYFDNYVAEFSIEKEKFTTSDSAVVSTWLNALASVRDILESGEDIGERTYLDLGLRETTSPDESELAINVNSPGEFSLRSVGPFAFVVMSFLPLMASSAEEILQSDIKVKVKAVGSTSPDCELPIEAAIAEYAKTLSVQRLNEACKIGLRAQKEATMKTKARVSRPRRR